MSTSVSDPDRRERSENETPPSKQRLSSHPSESRPPPAYWDNLTKIWLTKRALQELGRRNSQATLSSFPLSCQQHHPITRRALAEWKDRPENWQPMDPAPVYLARCSPRCLASIRQLARHGGPDLQDLRGVHINRRPTRSNTDTDHSFLQYQAPPNPFQPTMNLNRSGPQRTKNSTPYDANFQQKLIDAGVYPPGYQYPNGPTPAKPDNWQEIHHRLTQPRPSLTPSNFSEEEHTKFVQADYHAATESQVLYSVIPTIEGKMKNDRYVTGNVLFTNLDPLTDDGLARAKPDIYYGARPEQVDRRVRDELSGHIIPSQRDDLPISPNFFLEAKHPDESLAVANRQANHNIVLGQRGMDSLLAYGQDQPALNQANAITSTYHGGRLKIYTVHSTPTGPGGRPEYHMNQLRSFAMTDTPNSFREGAAACRNARDWAGEQRNKAIMQANERAGELTGEQADNRQKDG